MSQNDDAYDPPGDRSLARTGGQQEVIPYDPASQAFPTQQYPADQSPPKPRVLVERRTLLMMMGLILVLLLAAAGLAVKALGSHNSSTPLIVAPPPVTSTSSAPATPTDSPTPEPSPSPSPSASPSDTDTFATDSPSADAPTDTTDPSASFGPPFGSQLLGSPVDGEVEYTDRDMHVSNVDYPDSELIACPTGGLIDWNVAGFTTFTTVFGIPDDAQGATGIVNSVTFTDQNGHLLATAKTSIGQPASMKFALNGATRLIMSCSRQGSNDDNANFVTFGDASLSTS